LNDTIQGYFEILAAPHTFVEKLINKLSKTFKISLLSGDKKNGQEYWKTLFAKIKGDTKFAQSPENKLIYIKNLQNSGRKICMVGDGLNDAGALRQADSGIAIANSAHQFTPGSDAILLAEKLSKLPLFLSQAKRTLHLVRFCFFISVIYNLVGLSYAVKGDLQPIVAAILMPVSSLTVVLVAWLGTGWIGKK
jgi:Cu+-exporting ATPase